jgi:DMSO/TMAO reductase YedYZ molybdopterin-dependent catalytic subunit
MSTSPRFGLAAAAFSGAVAAAVAIAVGELIGGLIPGAPSLVVAVGDLVIALQPPGGKELVVSLFGENDKLALVAIVVGLAVAIAAALGVAGRRRWRSGGVGFLGAGLLAGVAVAREPLVEPVAGLATVVLAVGASLVALRVLLVWAGAPWAGPTRDRRPREASTPDWERRRFLLASGALAVSSVAVGVVGRSLLDSRTGNRAANGRPSAVPRPQQTAPSLPPGASFDVPGITPIVIPNDRFYRIDTALVVPRVDVSTWTLTVKGLVDRQVVLTNHQLADLPLFEQYITIACVSNRVGQNYVGNAKWTGAHLRDVLAMAGVQAGASQIVGRSVDGFTAGFPTEWAMDPSRDPMIAIGMNDAPLPPEHGYPARLIVPGLFGYVSATKWLSEIELTTLDAFDAYWVPLGWAKEAPILTQSRIDVLSGGSAAFSPRLFHPRRDARVPAGLFVVAGVAWAPDRGISGVEVRIDDGGWRPAHTSTPISNATWVQWRFDWAAVPGPHRIEVRATDGTGEIQTDRVTPPAPDGARGHHTIEVVAV